MNTTFSANCSFCGHKQNVTGPTFYCSKCKAFCNENGRLTIIAPEPSIEDKLRYDLTVMNNKCNHMYFDNIQLTNNLNKIQIDYTSLFNKNKELNKIIDELTKKLGSKTVSSKPDEKLVKDNDKLNKTINYLKKKINELESKPIVNTDELKEEINQLKEEILRIQDENSILEKNNINLNTKLTEVTTDLSKKNDELNELNTTLSLKLDENKKHMTKQKNANANRIKKLIKKHETQLNRLDDTHLDTIRAVNDNNRGTINKFKEKCEKFHTQLKISEDVNRKLKLSNARLLESIAFYSKHIEAYLQRNIIGIDIDEKTLKEPFFSDIKREMLIHYMGMVDIQYSRLKQLINTSSLMVCEVKTNIFIRHFYESFSKVIIKCEDLDIKKGLTIFSQIYSLKRLFILSRFNFNNLMEIVTTCIPKDKLVKTRDLILSELISSRENAELICEILRLKKCSKSKKYFAYARDVLNAMSGKDLSQIVDFEHDNLTSLCQDYIVDSLPVNINDVWYKIIEKYEKGLPGMKHNINPIVKCDDILKRKMNI